ncbi:MAG: VWA domain-containing protein [Actinobacteria bacterium]|nr:VWA domain-containing protein [Actinomycetota bacterium]
MFHRKDVYWFDPATESFSLISLNNAPEVVGDYSIATYVSSKNAIYIFGYRGSSRGNFILKYNIDDDTYEKLGVTPEPYNNLITAAAYCSSSDAVYLFGGSHSSSYFDLIQEFKPYNHQIETLSEKLLQPSGGNVGVYVPEDDKVYLFGGQGSKNNQNEIYEFECGTKQITKVLDMPTTLAHHGVAYVPGERKVYVIGGNTARSGGFAPATNAIYYLQLEESSNGLQLTFNQIDVSNFGMIDCYVTATDNQGNSLAGLTSANFAVREDGYTESPITVTQLGGGSEPIAVALTIDRSRSMHGQDITDAKSAANTFVDRMTANDKAAIISFNDQVKVDQTFTSNKTLLKNAISSLTAQGGTAIYDAVIESVNLTQLQAGRKAIVLMTDGADRDSNALIDEAISSAVQANLPVFTIGLGLTRGSSEEQKLVRIANETGGQYYYAPTSAELEQIYNLISQQLRNQYKIAYNTHNQNRDGTTRTVQINASYQGNSDIKTKMYVAPLDGGGSGVPIYPFAADRQNRGQEFWVDIKVGNTSNPVNNLFGVGFVLNYTNTNYIDVVMPYPSNVIASDILGSDLLFYYDVNDGAGRVSVGITRKSGQGGVKGAVSIVRVKFVTRSDTPDGTQINFTLSEITANDPNATSITLSPDDLNITITGGLEVWPGDTNNNGSVNQADVLPIGLYWNSTGPSRTNPTIQWNGQSCNPWAPQAATYADASGDGRVNQADVLPIGLNWGKTHSPSVQIFANSSLKKPNSPQSATLKPEPEYSDVSPGQEFDIYVTVAEVNSLFGLTFEMIYDRPEITEILSVASDGFLGSDVVFFSNVDDSLGIVSVGITKKSGQPGDDGTGSVVKIRAKIYDNVTEATKENFSLQDVEANDPEGNSIGLGLQSSYVNIITTGVDIKNHLPVDYKLFQNFPNPFNPTTTIQFDIPRSEFVSLKIIDLLGHEVETLIEKNIPAGEHSVKWDARGFSSGVYFYQFQTEGFTETKKLILMR